MVGKVRRGGGEMEYYRGVHKKRGDGERGFRKVDGRRRE